MNYQIKVGVIKLDKLETWKENKDPFDILDNCKEIERIDWITFLNVSKELFSDEVQVDWGGFAYKATKNQLKQLIEKYKAEINCLEDLPDENLGVVFIEIS